MAKNIEKYLNAEKVIFQNGKKLPLQRLKIKV